MNADSVLPYLWLSGEIMPWRSATVYVTELAVAGSGSVFEGIRGYWNDEQRQLYVFRLGEHVRRLTQSMKMVSMEPRFSPDELTEAVLATLRANQVREDIYIRQMAYQTGGQVFAMLAQELETQVAVNLNRLGSRLGTNASVAVCVSSWNRIADNVMPPRIKCGANYGNNSRVKREARTNGYDDGIILDARGKVTEATSAAVFIIREGTAITPPVTSGILESITRATLIELIRAKLKMRVVEREVDRTELYIADEVLTCGTGNEIKAITSVDRYPVGTGEVGPVAREVERLYENVVRGRESEYLRWCSPVWT